MRRLEFFVTGFELLAASFERGVLGLQRTQPRLQPLQLGAALGG
ncbi:hypothetical protein [Allochromatium vinosum]|nr:hypothetical protein [Allochromatium vinosum]